MNLEFLKLLDKAKTMSNAKAIESIKNLYIQCELKNDPNVGEEGTMKYFNYKVGREINGKALSDTCYEFSGENGTVKLTVIDSNTVLVEASPTGTDEMYHTVGQVCMDTSIDDALAMGFDSLDNENLVESWFENIKSRA